jgi:hypothetical protein
MRDERDQSNPGDGELSKLTGRIIEEAVYTSEQAIIRNGRALRSTMYLYMSSTCTVPLDVLYHSKVCTEYLVHPPYSCAVLYGAQSVSVRQGLANWKY